MLETLLHHMPIGTVLSWLVMQLPIGAALTWCLAKVAAYVHAHTNNTIVNGIMSRLDSSAVAVVKEIQQTVVDDLKAGKHGILTADDALNIKSHAMAKVKAYWGEQGIAKMMEILGLSSPELDAMLSSKIESAVHDLRNAAPVQAPNSVATN